jgi:N-methylhydantoinase B
MIDSITTEVIHHRLISAAKEMMRNLMRTSYSTIVYEIRDFGLGIYDAKGDLLAEAPGLAIFTRSNDYALKNAIEFVGIENIEPGDVLLLNYPYWSSAHTLDVAAFAPIYHEDTLVGFTAARIHWLDLKQKNAGYVLDSTDMHQEGIYFPCTKIHTRGKLNEDIVNLIRFNSRYPDRTVGDMLAQVSACVTGARRVEEIVERFGEKAFL